MEPAPTEPEGPPPLTNRQIAARLEEAADLLAALDENPFRVRAYRLAAETVRSLREPVHAILEAEGTAGLTRLPNIGDVLARAIQELATTGRALALDRLRGLFRPEELLATVPGIGPELAVRIRERLGVGTLEELEQAAHDGRLAAVPGMGAKRLRAVRDSLAGRLMGRPRAAAGPAADRPTVEELFAIDQAYRERAAAGGLRLVAPKRFNPTGQAWLPVFRARRGGRRYTVLFSNTAQAHRLGTTRDWVVVYWKGEGGGPEGQATVVTAKTGSLRGLRVVRGREAESAEYHQAHPAGAGNGTRPG